MFFHLTTSGLGLETFPRWWPPSTMWACPLIFSWPPPGMAEQSHLLEFGVMCCMLSTFHVSPRIVAKVSESSLPLSLNSPLGVAGGKYHKKITLPNLFFKILLFQAAFRIFFSIVIFLLTFFWLVWYCGVGIYFSQATWTKWTLMSAVPKMPLIPHSLYFVSCLWPVYCVLSMWGKIIIPMHTSWLHGLYGLHGPRCSLY